MQESTNLQLVSDLSFGAPLHYCVCGACREIGCGCYNSAAWSGGSDVFAHRMLQATGMT